MENKGQIGGESVQPIKEVACNSQPQISLALGSVPHHAISKGEGTQSQTQQLDKLVTPARRKRNASELTEEQLNKKRMADKKSKAKSKQQQEEIKSQRDELQAKNRRLKQEIEELRTKYTAKLEGEIDQMKREREKEQQFNSKLEELHSQIRKLEGELREKDDQLVKALENLASFRTELANIHRQKFEPSSLSIEPPQPDDHGNCTQHQSHSAQLDSPGQARTDLPHSRDQGDDDQAAPEVAFVLETYVGGVSHDFIETDVGAVSHDFIETDVGAVFTELPFLYGSDLTM